MNENNTTQIPHKIHFCWFGYNKKPRLIRKCIKSWKKYHPDWEIIEWNESSYDVNKIPYIKEAYEKKKWAFVVDFARFDILNEHGGVFLDADVELKKPIPDKYLEFDAFTGFENGNKIAPGLIFAAKPEQKMLNNIIEEYKQKQFSTNETICDIVTSILKKEGLILNDTFQMVSGITVFPQDYFCCFDHETQSFELTENTVSVHHYYASWSPWHRKIRFKTIKFVAVILGKERYLKIKRAIKRMK